MVVSKGILAVMRRIESRKGRVCMMDHLVQCHRSAEETG